MKYCPSCDTKFDDEVMRFCTKDGTPLIDEKEPNFVGTPSAPGEEPVPVVVSADEDEAGEVTVVRRNIAVPRSIDPVAPPPSLDDEDYSEVTERPAERIVVPMTPEPRVDPIRNRNAAVYYPPPKQNTLLVVVLTIFGTVAVLGVGAALFWVLQRGRASNTNVNTNLNANLNTNQNTNTGFDSNFNFNVSPVSPGTNSNIKFNANLKTPTPTPSPSPSVTPTPRPSITPTPDDVVIEPGTPRPTPSPSDGRPRISPTPPSNPVMRSTPRPTPHTFSTPDNQL